VGFFQLIVPAAGTNLITNPSCERNTTGWSPLTAGVIGGTVTVNRDTSTARYGVASLQVNAPSNGPAYQGAQYGGLTLAASTTYTLSFWLKGDAGRVFVLQAVRANIGTLKLIQVTGQGLPVWQAVTMTFTTTAAGRYDLQLYFNDTHQGYFWVDGVQLEQSSVQTTYMDGDQPGCSWVGTPHASQSIRSNQYRGGGMVVDFDALGFKVLDFVGTGMAPPGHISTPYALSDGSLWQRTRTTDRTFGLRGFLGGGTAANLTALRKALIDVLRPDLVSPQQPLRIRSTESGQTWEIQCHYTGGLQRGVTEGIYDETVQLQFIADDPYWYDIAGTSTSLLVQENITDANYIVQRDNDGVWGAMAGGLNGAVLCAVYDASGNVIVGGDFTIAYNGPGQTLPVTVNHVALWNGTTWSAMGIGFDSNTPGLAATVYALAIDGGGNIWAGGSFTYGAKYVAKWSGSSWIAPSGNSADGTGIVYALAYSPQQNRMYIGGSFTNWAGVANLNGLTAWMYNGWASDLGLLFQTEIHALIVSSLGNIYIGGIFNYTPGGTPNAKNVAMYDLASKTWSPIGAGLGTGTGQAVLSLALDTANNLYAGGTFGNAASPYIAKRSGSTSWTSLGTGVNATVYKVIPDLAGNIYAAGAFTSAGGVSFQQALARWNGSSWQHLWLTLPGVNPTAWCMAFRHASSAYPSYSQYDAMVVGFSTAGTAVSSNVSQTIVTNTGSSAVGPTLIMTGPGVVESIVNTTTGAGLYFNLTLQAGEVATLDLSQDNVTFVSNLAGRGNMLGTIASSSDVQSWKLQSGDNVVLVKFSGSTNGNTSLAVTFVARAWSSD
jgi:hypothetical protein